VPALETRDLTKRFGEVTAIEGLDLEASAGEVVGLLGPNGAGKSTTIKMLVGLVEPTRGSAHVLGHDAAEEGVAARSDLGYLPEVVGLYGKLTASAYLRYVARFHGLTGSGALRSAERLLARVRLSHAADRRIETYSKGMRQRLALAGALIHDPKVLVLDEPLSGLDPEGVVKMKGAIGGLGEERTVLVCSHELHAVESLCDRAVVLRDGEVLAEASVDELIRRSPPVYRIDTRGPAPQPAIVDDVQGVRAARRVDEHRLELEVDDGAAASRALARVLDGGHDVSGFGEARRTLEEAFVDIAGVRT
jgi:ABC-2 type transport system ATP-binding protein